MRLENRGEAFPNSLIMFNKGNKTTFIIHINYDLENDIFSLHEKVRILISKYDPDYYVIVSEAWAASKINENQQQVNYRRGDIAKLPSHEKTEILTFIGKFINSITRGPDKSEVYEIVRKKQNDEKSRIIELRKFDDDGLKFGCQDLISSEV